MFSLCAVLSACNSSTTDQSEAVLPQGSATNKISVCAPNIYFGKIANSPALFVNGEKLGIPTKGKNKMAYLSVGDEWEVTAKKNFWIDGPAQSEDVNVIKDKVTSSGDIFVIMTANPNWGDGIASLGQSGGGIIGAFVVGAVGGAVNAKNEYTPFNASKVTKSEFNKTCP